MSVVFFFFLGGGGGGGGWGCEYHDFLLCFDASTALSLFTANDPCQLSSVNFDTSLCSAVTQT